MQGINGFDAGVMEFIQANFHNPFTDAVFPVITYLGEAGGLWIALAIGLLFFKRTRTWGALTLCAMAVTFLIGEVLVKNLMCRPRPCQLFPDYVQMLIPPLGSWSFPSGHSASSFAAATTLSLCWKKRGWIAFIPAALIAFSRIFLFVHWPTDVVCGILFGVFFGFLTYFVYWKWIRRRAAHSK